MYDLVDYLRKGLVLAFFHYVIFSRGYLIIEELSPLPILEARIPSKDVHPQLF